MLKINKIDVFRSEVPILKEVTLQAKKGEMIALIGANGAGKTTLFETIFGFLHPNQGTIQFLGNDIHQRRSYEIARLGMALVPEGRRLFSDMNVLENIELAAAFSSTKTTRKNNLDFIFSLFPVLKTRLKQTAGTLSGGEQQMASIARAMMLNPQLLIVDELSLGLSPKFTAEVFEAIRLIKNQGVGIILAEQNAFLALHYSDRAYVLANGKIVQEGLSQELMNDPKIRTAYLGLA